MDGYICVLLVLFVLLGRSVGSELYLTVNLSPFSFFLFVFFFAFHAHIRCILNLNTSHLPTYLAVSSIPIRNKKFFQLPFTFYLSVAQNLPPYLNIPNLVHTSRTTYNMYHATPHERLICILWGQVGTYVVFYCTTYVCVYAYFVLLLYLWSDKWR